MTKRVPLLSAFILMAGISALADAAANAYVTVEAKEARAVNGLDFATGGEDPVVVTVSAQPGWVLTSPSSLTIPKGEAGAWSARSFYGESGAGGEICIPRSSVSTNHLSAPKVDISLHVDSGNRASGDDKDSGGDKERGGVINIRAAPKGIVAGRHRIVTAHDTCPGGKSNEHSETNVEELVQPDSFVWEWSVGGQSGRAEGQSLVVTGIRLPHGKHTVSVTLTVSNSACSACRASATAKKDVNIGNGVIK